jgi:hypothetical protein
MRASVNKTDDTDVLKNRQRSYLLPPNGVLHQWQDPYQPVIEKHRNAPSRQATDGNGFTDSFCALPFRWRLRDIAFSTKSLPLRQAESMASNIKMPATNINKRTCERGTVNA